MWFMGFFSLIKEIRYSFLYLLSLCKDFQILLCFKSKFVILCFISQQVHSLLHLDIFVLNPVGIILTGPRLLKKVAL